MIKGGNNYLIVLCPKLEDWFCKSARLVGINLQNYGLPNNPDELHKVINENLDKFEQFLDDILSRNHPRINTLKDSFRTCK